MDPNKQTQHFFATTPARFFDMTDQETDYAQLSIDIQTWALELGFSDCAITDTHLDTHETHLMNWLKNGFQGEMHYMEQHGTKRSRPAKLEPGTQSVISVRLDYRSETIASSLNVLNSADIGYISRYALGRDYHKLIRKRLQKLSNRIYQQIGDFDFRAFTDSAPVLEKALAEKSGLGWIGKHSNLLTQQSSSWFFLGELYTNLPLRPVRASSEGHCGSCTKCLEACPTDAIVAPYKVDARRCISYLTIELKGSIPLEFRRAIENRIYGCDDCQLYCPWTRFSPKFPEQDFSTRQSLNNTPLSSLFNWSETQFNERMVGSPIRRIGYERWLRNVAVALGNSSGSEEILKALQNKSNHPSAIVREHVKWALEQHRNSF